MPEKFLVSQITTDNTSLVYDTEAWLNLLNYYSITRLGFSEIPFNYIIDREGNIYEGVGTSHKSYVDSSEGVVLVGYFSNSLDLTPGAKKSLRSLIEDYSYKYGISRHNVLFVDLGLVKNAEAESSMFSFTPSSSILRESFDEIIKNFRYSNEINLEFSGSISSLNYRRSVNVGDLLRVKVSLENKDDFAWYIDEGFLFLSTIDSVESKFAINQVWDSFSKPLSVKPQVVYIGDELETVFHLQTSYILPGKYTESFEFVIINNKAVKNSRFVLNFEVSRGDAKIIEIQRTGAGRLAVYECPQFTCTIMGSVFSGEQHVVLEKAGDWYKIHFDGVEGWVTAHHVNEI